MKGAIVLISALFVTTVALAGDGQAIRKPDASDFSQAYLDQVKTERAKEDISPSEASRDHAKYLKDTLRRDHFSRGN